MQCASKQIPIIIWERKGNPQIDFVMTVMASSIACVHACMHAYIDNGEVVQDGGHTPANRLTSLVYGYPCYGHFDTCQIRYLTSSIMSSYCGLNFRVHQDHMIFLS